MLRQWEQGTDWFSAEWLGHLAGHLDGEVCSKNRDPSDPDFARPCLGRLVDFFFFCSEERTPFWGTGCRTLGCGYPPDLDSIC